MLPYFALLVAVSLLTAASTGLATSRHAAAVKRSDVAALKRSRATTTRRHGFTVLEQRGAAHTGETSGKAPKWSIYDALALGLLVAFAGSRVGIGTDYSLYVSLWGLIDPSYMATTMRNAQQEVGFVYLQLALRLISDNPQILFWATAALTVIPVYWVIKDRSRSPALAVWLFIALGAYLFPLNVVRQGLAVSIVLVAVIYFMDRRRWVGLFLVALATAIHTTAAPVALVMYLAKNWRPSGKQAIAVIAGGAILVGLVVQSAAFRDLAVSLNPRYLLYLEENPVGIGTYLTIVAKALLIAICYANTDRLDHLDRRYLLYALIGLAVTAVGTQAQVLVRLDLYFSIFLILVVPNAIKGLKSPLQQMAVVVGSALYMAAFLANYAGLLPYASALWQ